MALLKASIIGLCQFVICTGQAANKIALAAKAGFISSDPPTKSLFNQAIAIIEPIKTIHMGTVGGILYANRIPVTTALKSLIVMGFSLTFGLQPRLPRP